MTEPTFALVASLPSIDAFRSTLKSGAKVSADPEEDSRHWFSKHPLTTRIAVDCFWLPLSIHYTPIATKPEDK